ncbi:hypothetical protein Efla_005196 [Eimeria flavescens]
MPVNHASPLLLQGDGRLTARSRLSAEKGEQQRRQTYPALAEELGAMRALACVALLLPCWGVSGFSWFPREGSLLQTEAEDLPLEEAVPHLSVPELQAIVSSSRSSDSSSSSSNSSSSTSGAEAAVLLFASWDSSSTLLLQTWRQAALSFRERQRGCLSCLSSIRSFFFSPRKQTQTNSVITASFDCAQQQQQQQQQHQQQHQQQQQEASAICRSLGVLSLPALLYFTPKPIRQPLQQQHPQQQQQQQQLLGFFDDESDAGLHPRATRYKGDLLVKEAVLDWLLLLRFISRVQRLTSSSSSSKQQQQQQREQQQQQQIQKQQKIIEEQQQLLQQKQMELKWLHWKLQNPS